MRQSSSSSGDAAIAMLTAPDAPALDAVVLDLVMPGLDGMGVLAKIREASLNIPVIVQTAHGGIDNVVSAMRAGAQDFVVKPVGIERLQVSLRNALNASALKGELQRIKHSREGRLTFADIITRSETMAGVLRTAQKAASSTIPVLVEGESGVGKELFARAIHGSGERKSKPFVAVNCGAIPDNLVESILFGHEKGAFTGATERHTGKFVEASGGTLFLDEVSELPLPAQVKLLRALQEGAVEAVGGRKPVKVDVRIISATNRKLLDRVKSGHFREDLFYRLHVLPLTIPPLRMRREDIPHLLRHFLARFCAEENRPHHRHQRRGDGPPVAARVARQYPPARERGLSRRCHERGRPARACRFSASRWRNRRRRPSAHAAQRTAVLGPAFIRPRRPWFQVTKYLSRRCRPPGRCDADQRRRNAAAGRNGKRDHPLRDLALSRTDVRGRAPAENRPLDALSQAR